MPGKLQDLTIHVPNVWQTCEWYRQVFGLPATLTPNATAACLDVAGHRLCFVAHDDAHEIFGTRRRNSFLSDPPAFHLDIVTADVSALFDHALAHGAVAVRPPEDTHAGEHVATLRDLNGLLIRLLEQ